MALIRKRVLGVIDRVYDLVGAKRNPTDLDVSLPVQCVHDIARQGELGSGLGQSSGFIWWHRHEATAAASSYRNGEDIDAWIEATSLANEFDVEKHWVWFMGWAGGWTDVNGNGDVDEASLGFIFPAGNRFRYDSDTEDDTVLVWLADSTQPIMSNEAGSVTRPSIFGAANSFVSVGTMPSRPFPIPQGSAIGTYVKTNAAIANGYDFYCLLWVGTRGVMPPGMG